MSGPLTKGSVGADGRPTSGSMARAIYDSLAALVPLHPDEDPAGRSKLAVAVADGVISHLKTQTGALHGTVNVGGSGNRNFTITVDVAP
jgi:hypothetical protein